MRNLGHLALVLCALLPGCSTTAEPGGASASPAPPAADIGRSDATGRVNAPFVLRAALTPSKTAQTLRIQVHERRETTGETCGTVVHVLDLDLRGKLVGIGQNEKHPDCVNATLTFERIVLSFGMPSQPGAMFHYDSASDRPNQGNPLADMMAHVADAELSLMVGPTGELRSLHGLDVLWRKANLLMAPPALLTAQWLFRDVGMSELIGEAMFPPMPTEPVHAGDAWEMDIPANIPLVARLNAHVRAKLKQATSSSPAGGEPAVTIEAIGTIIPAPPIIADETPAICPVVKSGSARIAQTIAPQSRRFSQQSDRSLEVLLSMTPPAGQQRQEMTIRQTRTLSAERL